MTLKAIENSEIIQFHQEGEHRDKKDGNMMTKLTIPAFSLFGAIAYAQPSDKDYSQDSRLLTIDQRINKHLVSASAQLAQIQTKLNLAIGKGTVLITGLLAPWVKKVVIGLFIVVALGFVGCMPANLNKQVEVCQVPPCRAYCRSQYECHPACFCGRDGLCRNRY